MAEQGEDFSTDLDLPVLMDPVIERVLSTARDFQGELDMASSDDVQTIASLAIGELNNRWRPFMGRVKVSGQVSSPIVLAREFQTEGQSMFVLPYAVADHETILLTNCQMAEQECASLGFGLVGEDVEIDGEQIGTRPIIKLVFKRMVYVNCYSDDNPEQVQLVQRIINFMADINSVVLEFPFESGEFTRIRAREYFDRNVQSLNYLRVRDCKVADKLMALRHETVFLPEALGHNDAVGDSTAALERYANFILGCSNDDNYFVADLNAGVCLFNDMTGDLERIGIDPSSQRYIKFFGLRLRPKVIISIADEGVPLVENSKEKMEFRLVAKLLGETAAADSLPVEIRLSDLKNIESTRDFLNA